jgi:signal transduction histidine kinase
MDEGTRAVLSLARSVLGELDLDLALERVLEAARQLTGARYAALGVLDETRTELARFLTLGIDEATRREIGSLPRGRGVLGELISNPVPLRLADVGSHPRSFGFPPGHPPMRSFLGVPLLVEGEPYGNLYLTDKQGAEFTAADEEAVVLLAEFAGVAIDHARRYTGSERRRAELQETVNALEATLEIARALGGETDLHRILELVAKRGRALVCARALVIELERDGELVVAAAAGDLPEGLLGRRLSLKDTVASTALRTGRPQHLADKLNRARFEQHGLGRFGLRAGDGLIVPLMFRGRAYGALVALDPVDGARFNAEHLRLLDGFAASAATAVATAQSVADERRRQTLAAAEAERGRWARELHDETLQSLGALRLLLAGVRRGGGLGPIAAVIDEAVSQVDSDIDNLRVIIADLRPADIDQLGTAGAIKALAEQFAARGLAVDVSVELPSGRPAAAGRDSLELETAIYRIVQEALTNAIKHGGARRAVVEVMERDEAIRVTVRDDGSGFDPAAKTPGFGLPGMRERAELLDGTLAVHSVPGEGTRIEARFPGARSGARGARTRPSGAAHPHGRPSRLVRGHLSRT